MSGASASRNSAASVVGSFDEPQLAYQKLIRSRSSAEASEAKGGHGLSRQTAIALLAHIAKADLALSIEKVRAKHGDAVTRAVWAPQRILAERPAKELPLTWYKEVMPAARVLVLGRIFDAVARAQSAEQLSPARWQAAADALISGQSQLVEFLRAKVVAAGVTSIDEISEKKRRAFVRDCLVAAFERRAFAAVQAELGDGFWSYATETAASGNRDLRSVVLDAMGVSLAGPSTTPVATTASEPAAVAAPCPFSTANIRVRKSPTGDRDPAAEHKARNAELRMRAEFMAKFDPHRELKAARAAALARRPGLGSVGVWGASEADMDAVEGAFFDALEEQQRLAEAERRDAICATAGHRWELAERKSEDRKDVEHIVASFDLLHEYAHWTRGQLIAEAMARIEDYLGEGATAVPEAGERAVERLFVKARRAQITARVDKEVRAALVRFVKANGARRLSASDAKAVAAAANAALRAIPAIAELETDGRTNFKREGDAEFIMPVSAAFVLRQIGAAAPGAT